MEIIAEAVKNILTDTKLTDEKKEEALNNIHDLVKALKAQAPSGKEISTAHEIYEKLWYKIGAFVQRYDAPDIGIIIKYNTSTWIYDGKRYPIIITFPFGTFEYSILTTHYDEVENYKDTPKKILEVRKDDIAIHCIKDLDPSTAEKVIATQTLLENMHKDDLIAYSHSESFKNEKLPYIKELVTEKIAYQRKKEMRDMIFVKCRDIDNMSLDNLVKYIEWDKFIEDRKHKDIEEYAYEKLKRIFNGLKWETLLKYYDTKDYGKDIKEIMREIIETK